jgi:hypothetical protein
LHLPKPENLCPECGTRAALASSATLVPIA